MENHQCSFESQEWGWGLPWTNFLGTTGCDGDILWKIPTTGISLANHTIGSTRNIINHFGTGDLIQPKMITARSLRQLKKIVCHGIKDPLIHDLPVVLMLIFQFAKLEQMSKGYMTGSYSILCIYIITVVLVQYCAVCKLLAVFTFQYLSTYISIHPSEKLTQWVRARFLGIEWRPPAREPNH